MPHEFLKAQEQQHAIGGDQCFKILVLSEITQAAIYLKQKWHMQLKMARDYNCIQYSYSRVINMILYRRNNVSRIMTVHVHKTNTDLLFRVFLPLFDQNMHSFSLNSQRNIEFLVKLSRQVSSKYLCGCSDIYVSLTVKVTWSKMGQNE